MRARSSLLNIICLCACLELFGCGAKPPVSESASAPPPDSSVVTSPATAAPDANLPPWVAVNPSSGKYSIQMPIEPKRSTRGRPTAWGLADGEAFEAVDNGIEYRLIVLTYASTVMDGGVDQVKILSRLADDARDSFKKTQPSDPRQFDRDGHPGVELEFSYPAGRRITLQGQEVDYPAGRVIERVFRDGNDRFLRQYVTIDAAAEQADPNAVNANVERFFDSLKFE